jgi:SAM-dependent methyltransferase
MDTTDRRSLGLTATRSTRRGDCRLCGSPDLERVIALAPTPPADEFVSASRVHEPQQTFPLDVFLCLACGLVQLLDVVDPGSIYVDYRYVTTSSPGLVEHFRSYADEVVARLGIARGSTIVEIGSNDGTLLSCFTALGMHVLGIDPAREIARAATTAGLETIPECFSLDLARRLRRERGAADVIIANNVIANIDDLQDLAEGVRALLAPGGAFVFESGYLADLVEKMVFDNIYHEHLCYHSVRPLDRFLSRHGLQWFDVRHVGTKGGSLRGFVQHAGGPHVVSDSIAAMIEREDAHGYYRPDTYTALCDRLDRRRATLVDVIAGLRLRGRLIAGYGASHSVTTLLHHFGIADQLAFLVDDNPRKHGLYSPGHHLPVLPSSVLAERKPDYVVILPWRFTDAIVSRNHTFIAAGGRFIVPLSETRII